MSLYPSLTRTNPLLPLISPSTGAKPLAIASKLKALFAQDAWGYRMLSPLVQDAGDELTVIEMVEKVVLAEATTGKYYNLFSPIMQILNESEILRDDGQSDWVEAREEETRAGPIDEKKGAANDEDDGYEHSDESLDGGVGAASPCEASAEDVAKRVKLFAEPAVKSLVEWLNDDSEDESGSDEESSDGGESN